MNPNTGHLYGLEEGQELPEGYVEVPKELQEEAQQVVAGKERDEG